MRIHHRLRSACAAVGALALVGTGLFVATPPALAADTPALSTDGQQIKASDYLESDYMSRWYSSYFEGMGLARVSPHDRVARGVTIEPVGDEDENFNQTWRVTWNAGDPSNSTGKGTGALPSQNNRYNFWDSSSPYMTLAISQDLVVLNDNDHKATWTFKDRSDGATHVKHLNLWQNVDGDQWNDLRNGEGAANTVPHMYYVGQYVNAAGQAAPQDWQTKARACLAGNKSSSWATGGKLSSSPCDNAAEWLNNSNESFNSGVEGLSADATGGSAFDVSDADDRVREANQRKLFNFYANKIGGLQTFQLYTRNKGSRDMVVSVEFTTHRVPWAGAQETGTKRTFVAASYKSFDTAPSDWGGTYWQAFAAKYKEFTDVDSDGDGLTDRFELGIGTCAFPKDNAEYAKSTYCHDVENPKDTDGDGVEDGQEVTSTTPKATPTGFKITGTDPTVAPQKPSKPAAPTGKRGEVITGTAKPYMTVELYDVTGKKLLGSTVADKDGKYELTVGKALDRAGINKYGNNIKFSDEANRVPELYDLPEANDIADGDTVVVNFWSDGMDNLGSSDTTRPQFSKPTGAVAIQPDVEPIEVDDPANLTDKDKGKIKDKVDDVFPGVGDGDITVNPDGSATVKVPVKDPTTGEESTSLVTIPAEDLVKTKQAEPSADQSTLSVAPATDGDTELNPGDSAKVTGVINDADGNPIAGRDLTVQLPGGTTVAAKTDGNGNIVGTGGQPITFTAANDGDVKVFDGANANTTGTPLKTADVDVKDRSIKSAEIVGAPDKAYVGDEVNGLTANLTDGEGAKPTSGTVYVQTPGMGQPQAAQVKADGTIDIPAFTPDTEGTAEVKVFADAAGTTELASKSITVAAKQPAVQVPTSGTITGADTTGVTGKPVTAGEVEVKDAEGKPVANGTVYVKNPETGALTPVVVTNGKGTLPSFTPSKAGDYTIAVYADQEGNTPLTGAETTLKVSDPAPSAENSSVKVNPSEPVEGSTATVDGTIKDANGKPIAGRDLTVQLPDGSTVAATTDNDGTIVGKDGNKITFPAADGDVKVFDGANAATSGDPIVKTTIDAKDRSIAKATVQNVPAEATVGSPVSGVTATVVDGEGDKVASGTVYVKVPGSDELKPATVKDGKVIVPDFTPPAAGDQKIEIFSDAEGNNSIGSATFQAAEKPAPVADKVEIKDVPDSVTAGDKVTGGKVTATTADGNPATGATVYAKVPGATDLVPLTVGADGSVDLPEFTPTKDDSTVKVFATNDATGTPLAEKTVTVNEPAQVPSGENSSVKVNPDQPVKGATATVEGTIKDANGKPIAGRDLTVVMPNGEKVPATTDNDGTIVGTDGQPITITAANDGDVKVFDGANADISGDPLVKTTVTTKAGDFDPANSEISVTTGDKTVGESHTVTVTLKDKYGNPITDPAAVKKAQEQLTITAKNGDKVATNGYFTPVDGQPGVYTMSVTAKEPGQYTVEAKVGDTALKGSGATANFVKKDEPATKATTPSGVTAVTDPDAGTTTVSGKTDPNTPVTVTLPDGTKVTGKSDDEGNFTIEVKPAATDGAELTVTAGEGEQASDSATVKSTTKDQPVTPMAKPDSVSAINNPDGTTTVNVYGKGMADGTVVTVKDADGNIIATGTLSGSNATFTIEPGVKTGTTVTATFGEGTATSEPAETTAVDRTKQPTDLNAQDTKDGVVVTGKTDPGATVFIDKDEKTIATGKADDNGNFSITVKDAKAGDTLTVSAGKTGTGVSEPATVKVAGTDNGGKGNGGTDGNDIDAVNGGDNGNQGAKAVKQLATTGATATRVGMLSLLGVALGGLFVAAARRRNDA